MKQMCMFCIIVGMIGRFEWIGSMKLGKLRCSFAGRGNMGKCIVYMLMVYQYIDNKYYYKPHKTHQPQSTPHHNQQHTNSLSNKIQLYI